MAWRVLLPSVRLYHNLLPLVHEISCDLFAFTVFLPLHSNLVLGVFHMMLFPESHVQSMMNTMIYTQQRYHM